LKKKQKTSGPAGRGAVLQQPAGEKIFFFFFSRKEALAILTKR
jgi:hypothetical protein